MQTEYQMQMEKLFHKNQLMKRVTAEFKKETMFGEFFKAQTYSEGFGYDLLAQMAIHKRANVATLVGLLSGHFADVQDCANEIERACSDDLINWNPATQMFHAAFFIDDEVQAEIDRYQYPLPMIVEPRKVNNNTQSGYLLPNGSIILKGYNHHTDDVCLDHINRMNSIRLKINQDTAHAVKNEWKNMKKPKVGETWDQFQQRKKQLEKFNTTSMDVIQHIGIANGNAFYLTHKYDKRGRVYCQGYHVNYQGNTWNKAVIEFAHQETVE